MPYGFIAGRGKAMVGAGLLAGALMLSTSLLAAPKPARRPAAQTPATATPAVPIKGFVDTYCVACHNQRMKTAGLVFENRDLSDVGKDAEMWERVITKMHAGAMPPPGSKRPDGNTYQAFIDTVERSLDTAAVANADPGRPPIHRLNRLEYTNAIRDLLALEIDGKAMLPADDSGFGFDNIADVLSVSPGLLERYLLAANKISRLAVGDPSLVPGSTVYDVSDRTMGQDDRMSEALPFGSRGGAAIRHYFPLDGEYSVKFTLQRSDLAATNMIRGLDVENLIDVRLDRERLKVVKIGGGGDKPTFGAVANYYAEEFAPDDKAEFRFQATAGTHTLAVALNRDHWYMEGVGVNRLSLTSDAFNQGVTSGTGSGRIDMTIRKLTIGGPFNGTVPKDSPSRRRVFVCKPVSAADEAACATRILSSLARRAYRRPVTAAEVKDLVTFYQKGREGATFDTGIQTAMARLLVDVKFLFRLEADPAGLTRGASYRVRDIDLASRLSFFLWSSIPDDELLRVAASGTLRQPAVLERQVRRMLADPRSSVMISNFFEQWLYLRNMASVRPDPARFPTFDDNLRLAFQEETRLFLESQVREDRPVTELMTASYTFVNERLAKHYGMPNVAGSHFRRVNLPDDTRAGLLGHGSILTVTSYADRTSVVQRGKWVMDHLLGVPPPPPPANVPPLDDTKIQGSLRQRMELHRKNPVCATCHTQIDPMGFALENFDAVGQFRTLDGGAPIDPSGRLMDGTLFNGPTSFRKALLGRSDGFRSTLTQKLLTYAMGRGVEYFDMPAVRQVMRESKISGDRWSSVVLAIVKSKPFQMRRAES
ncbi:MAG: DUF1592 domain-containing protein [Vicinamibacterales bacterium]|nr:DUF1592 domain-containing protein [Vicinamibacterales bacterium]